MSNEYVLAPIDQKTFTQLSSIEPTIINQAMANQFFMMKVDKQGNPQFIIKKAGLLWKLDQLHKGNYQLETTIATAQEHVFYKQLYGVPEKAFPFIVCHGTLTLDIWDEKIASYKTRVFKDTSIVTSQNFKGNLHPVELAKTRAMKRVIQQAIACGFAVAEEDEENGEVDQEALRKERARKRLMAICNKKGWSRDKRLEELSKILEREIDTTKNLCWQEFEYLSNAIEISDSYKKEAEKKKDDIVDAEIILPGPSAEQLTTINNLFKELNFTVAQKNSLFKKVSITQGKEIKSENDLDIKHADNLINWLKEKKEARKQLEMEVTGLIQTGLEKCGDLSSFYDFASDEVQYALRDPEDFKRLTKDQRQLIREKLQNYQKSQMSPEDEFLEETESPL